MSGNVTQQRIERLIKECDKHVYRIDYAYRRFENILPLTADRYKKLTDEEIEHIDQFIFRFSKLQDAMGQRLFQSILEFLQEDVSGLPFVDILNKLEKIDLIESGAQWQKLREIRNSIAHEYDDSPEWMTQSLNSIFNVKNEILKIYGKIKLTYKNRI